MDRPSTLGAKKLPATRARQGSWGRHILAVLVISTLLAAAVLFLVFGGMTPDTAPEVERQQASEAFDQPVAAP